MRFGDGHTEEQQMEKVSDGEEKLSSTESMGRRSKSKNKERVVAIDIMKKL